MKLGRNLRLLAHGALALMPSAIKVRIYRRVFGFEIMSAPFVIAHWQVGNLLAGLARPSIQTRESGLRSISRIR